MTLGLLKKKKSLLYVPVIPEIESWKSDFLFLIIIFPGQSGSYNAVFSLVSQTCGHGQKNVFIFRGLGADSVCLQAILLENERG